MLNSTVMALGPPSGWVCEAGADTARGGHTAAALARSRAAASEAAANSGASWQAPRSVGKRKGLKSGVEFSTLEF